MRTSTEVQHGINTDTLQAFIQDACIHYEKSSPAVSNYLDNLYIRVSEDTQHVSLFELLRTHQLYDVESEQWMNPNLAQNTVYKTLDILEMNTTGMIDF
jgi:hypothetical protein